MLKEDKEVFKTCVILALLAVLVTAFFMIEVEESRIKRLQTHAEELQREIFLGQGVLRNDEQIQDNSQ
jgi:Tfp pilus assembly protein FimT